MLRDAVRQHRVPIVFVNLVGGNDELIFDGTSFAVDADARVVARLRALRRGLRGARPVRGAAGPRRRALEPDPELLERALVLGIRDYLGKLGLRPRGDRPLGRRSTPP